MAAPNPWLTPDVSRMLASLTTPQFDLGAMTEAQRKNMEAMSAVCLLALDCISESARKQSALLAETVDHLLETTRTAGMNGGDGGMAAQRALFTKGVEAMREIAELIAKSNGEALDIVGRRAQTCLDELNGIAKKGTSRA